MINQIRWSAQLLNEIGEPVGRLAVGIEMFDSNDGIFKSVAETYTSNEGRISDLIELRALRSITPSLALRLLLVADPPLVLHAFPRLSLDRGELSIDFGSLILLPRRAHFLPDAATRELPVELVTVGGLPAVKGQLPPIRNKTEPDSRLESVIRILDAQIRLMDSEAKITQRELADKSHELTRTDAEMQDLREDLALFRLQADQKVSIAQFVAAVGDEMGIAQQRLEEKGFQIASIGMTTRAFVDDGGKSLQFPNRADRADVAAAPASDISIAFQPVESTIGEDVKMTVPNVNQLTESAARQVLSSIGLQLEAIYGPPPSGRRTRAVDGQAMLQTPAPGARAERGESILVLFAVGATRE